MAVVIAVAGLCFAFWLCFHEDHMPNIEDVEDAGLKPRDPRQGRF